MGTSLECATTMYQRSLPWRGYQRVVGEGRYLPERKDSDDILIG